MHEEIPVLVNLNRLSKHVHDQVRYFENDPLPTDYILEPWQESYVNRFLTGLPRVEGELVVECGTGPGYMAIELARRGARVIATDITLQSLIRLQRLAAREGLADRIGIVCCSADRLPIRSGLAKALISNAVLEHLEREPEAVAEIARVGGRDALVFMTVPLKLRWVWPIFWAINWIHDRRIGHLRRYDRTSLLRLFGPYGFAERTTYYTGHMLKVAVVLLTMAVRFRSARLLKWLEVQDRRAGSRPYGASNIITIMSRSA